MSKELHSYEIKVPVLPESVSDAVVISWYKQPGEMIQQDEPIVDIETDKVVLEVPSPVNGMLQKIIESNGSIVQADQLLGTIILQETFDEETSEQQISTYKSSETEPLVKKQSQKIISPAAHKMIMENKLDPDTFRGSGKAGRILKEDVLKVLHLDSPQSPPINSTSDSTSDSTKETQYHTEKIQKEKASNAFRDTKRVPMTRLRARIAQRLLDSQHNAAILTTFNEVNMQAVMTLRKRYKDLFNQKHQVKLGFMSFFIMAAVEALKRFPVINAAIDGNDIIYHGYYDIGVAVSSPSGLVVPVLKNIESMSMADIELSIRDLAIKARDKQLSIDEITGGTFSVTNGGTFGSLLSTPIINPPQSAILGMHKIEDRPVVEQGEIVIRPIMYLALSYDHRIIDGSEAVQFLVAIKNYLEDPSRLLLEI